MPGHIRIPVIHGMIELHFAVFFAPMGFGILPCLAIGIIENGRLLGPGQMDGSGIFQASEPPQKFIDRFVLQQL